MLHIERVALAVNEEVPQIVVLLRVLGSAHADRVEYHLGSAALEHLALKLSRLPRHTSVHTSLYRVDNGNSAVIAYLIDSACLGEVEKSEIAQIEHHLYAHTVGNFGVLVLYYHRFHLIHKAVHINL